MKLENSVYNPIKRSESEFSGDSRNDLLLLLQGMQIVVDELRSVLGALSTVTDQSLQQRLSDLTNCVTTLPNTGIEVTAAAEGGKEKIQACLVKATALTQTISTGVIGILGLQVPGVGEADND